MSRGVGKDALKPYFALHVAVAGRVDLAPADKVTWAALADFLPRVPQTEAASWIRPPAGWLARKAGLSRRQVHRSLRRLEAAGLIVRRQYHGQPAQYAILDPPPLEPDMTDVPCHRNPGQIVTGGVTDCQGGVGQIVTPGGGQIVTPSHVHERTTRGSPLGVKYRATGLEEITAIEAAATAYRKARHGPLPATWVATILLDCRAGAAETWQQVTAADLREAYGRLSASRKLDFAPWHARNCVLDRLGAEASVAARRDAAAAAKASDAKARDDHQAATEAAWDRCTPQRQAELTVEAERQCRRIRGAQRAAVVASTARFLAWQAETRQESKP